MITFDDETIVKDERNFMLSTLDNPYNPYRDFDRWYTYDSLKGYHTCEYLARVTLSSDDLSEEDQNLAITKAMEQILDFNVTGNYIKVYEDDIVEPKLEPELAV